MDMMRFQLLPYIIPCYLGISRISCNIIDGVFLFTIYIDHALVDVDVEVAGVLRPAQQRGQQEGGDGEHRHQQGLRPAHPGQQSGDYAENSRVSIKRTDGCLKRTDGKTDRVGADPDEAPAQTGQNAPHAGLLDR